MKGNAHHTAQCELRASQCESQCESDAASQCETQCEIDTASPCESQCEGFLTTQCERRGKPPHGRAPRCYDVINYPFYDPIRTSYGKSSSTFDSHQATGCIVASRTTPAFKRRAGLTARPDSEGKIGCATNLPITKTEPPKGPCQQRHQNATHTMLLHKNGRLKYAKQDVVVETWMQKFVDINFGGMRGNNIARNGVT